MWYDWNSIVLGKDQNHIGDILNWVQMDYFYSGILRINELNKVVYIFVIFMKLKVLFLNIFIWFVDFGLSQKEILKLCDIYSTFTSLNL